MFWNIFFDIIGDIIDFCEKLLEAAINKKNKTKDILTLKSEIKTCEKIIARSYSEIGRKYYEMNKDKDFDEKFGKYIRNIENAKRTIEILSNQVMELEENKTGNKE